jgi:hypothetical protein
LVQKGCQPVPAFNRNIEFHLIDELGEGSNKINEFLGFAFSVNFFHEFSLSFFVKKETSCVFNEEDFLQNPLENDFDAFRILFVELKRNFLNTSKA